MMEQQEQLSLAAGNTGGRQTSLIWSVTYSRRMRARYNSNVPNWWFLQTWAVGEILRHVVPTAESTEGRVGILGSAALLLYQEENRTGPVWPGTRMSKSLSGSESEGKWTKPSDYDVFVSGPHGRSKEAFLKFASDVVAKIEGLGYVVKMKGKEFQMYTRGGRLIWIVNFYIGGVRNVVSLIQSPDCCNLREVLAKFDIDVCRVAYNFHERKASCSESVGAHIAQSMATVDSIPFTNGGPTLQDQRDVVRTMARILKYKRRGFSFPRCEGVAFSDMKS